MLRRFLIITFTFAASINLASCYRIPVPQGNYITQNDAHKIRKGMTPIEVVNTLGNPVLNNVYINGQLAYVYTYKKSLSKLTESRLIIYFQHDRVSDVEFNYRPKNKKLSPTK